MKYGKKIFFSVILSLALFTGCSNLDIEKLNNKANNLMSAGDTDGAIARLESINDLNPNFPQTHYNLGIAYHKKKNYEKAIASLNRAISLKKDFAEAYYTLGVIYEELGLNIIEENKHPDKKQISDIVDSFILAQEEYEKYIRLTTNTSDLDSVNTKINTLKIDIQKYSSMLENKPN